MIPQNDPAFKARRQLAVVDQNYDKDYPSEESQSSPGDVMVTRKYNQRKNHGIEKF